MKDLINKTLTSHAGLETLILRVPIGLILAAHGSQKLFGWFHGHGLDGTGQFMAALGFSPGYVMALLVGCGEFFGGIALMLGLLTRVAALANVLIMVVALFWVHWNNGFFNDRHGIEYPLALLAVVCTLAVMGGGRYSVDKYLVKLIR